MKTVLTTLILCIGFLFLSPTAVVAQNLQKIEIRKTKANFSKAVFRKALKKEGLDKQINIKPLVKTLHCKNGKWSFLASPKQITAIDATEQFTIKNNMMSGMVGSSPI